MNFGPSECSHNNVIDHLPFEFVNRCKVLHNLLEIVSWYFGKLSAYTPSTCWWYLLSLTLYVFRDLRQEVTVLAQLNHPNIVALLGVSIRPMCMVIEFAPMGSLFGALDKTVEQIKQDQADRASVILRMPGGVLGREITMKIALQVRSNYCHGLSSYIHCA